jgi:hypothetical protein
LAERTILTGLGDIGIKAPRVRDRASKIQFTSDPGVVFAGYEDDRGVVALVVLEKHFDRRFF